MKHSNCARAYCSKPFPAKKGKKYCSRSCKGSARTIRGRRELKRKAVEFMGGKCERCGYKECQAALQFHHKNPDKKAFAVSSKLSISFSKLKKELKKCHLICSNCHWLLHYNHGEDDKKIDN